MVFTSLELGYFDHLREVAETVCDSLLLVHVGEENEDVDEDNYLDKHYKRVEVDSCFLHLPSLNHALD